MLLILICLFFSQRCLLSSRENCRVAQRAVNEGEKKRWVAAEKGRERERVKYELLSNENCEKSTELRPLLFIVWPLWDFTPAISRNFSVQSYRADLIPQQDGFLLASVLRLPSTLVESLTLFFWSLRGKMINQVIRCIRLVENLSFWQRILSYIKSFTDNQFDIFFDTKKIAKLFFFNLSLPDKINVSKLMWWLTLINKKKLIQKVYLFFTTVIINLFRLLKSKF